jgi:hypothetical protein
MSGFLASAKRFASVGNRLIEQFAAPVCELQCAGFDAGFSEIVPPGPLLFKTSEEANRYLAEERESWER